MFLTVVPHDMAILTFRPPTKAILRELYIYHNQLLIQYQYGPNPQVITVL